MKLIRNLLCLFFFSPAEAIASKMHEIRIVLSFISLGLQSLSLLNSNSLSKSEMKEIIRETIGKKVRGSFPEDGALT